MGRRVLLVEDETQIRKGLRALVERAGLSFNEIEECNNGLAALEKLSHDSFDLLIVDIRMPLMDGVTLLKELQQRDMHIQIIILSGYDDFNYAKEAMRYGASYYMLKPVDRFELVEALEKVEKELQREEQLSRDTLNNEKLLNQIVADELNYIFLNENLSLSEVEKILATVGLDFLNNEYHVAVISVMREEKTKNKDSNISVLQFIDSFFSENPAKKFSFLNKDGNIVLLADRRPDYYELVKFLFERCDEEYFIGASLTENGAQDLRQTYIKACNAMKYRLIIGEQYIFEDMKLNHFEDNYSIPEDLICRAAEMVGTNRLDEINKIIASVFDNSIVCKAPISYIEKSSECIYQHMIKPFIKYLPYETDEGDDSFITIKNVYSYTRLQDYIFALKNYIAQMNEYIWQLKNEYKGKNSVDEAIQWLEENYSNQNVTMSLVANQVSLNYSYFSLAFREKTGMSFVNYIKQLRINRAKDLLKNSNLKINEVSAKVGFQSPRLFARSFREEVGISPLEYSKKL